jgi:hypothetical protein
MLQPLWQLAGGLLPASQHEGDQIRWRRRVMTLRYLFFGWMVSLEGIHAN